MTHNTILVIVRIVRTFKTGMQHKMRHFILIKAHLTQISIFLFIKYIVAACITARLPCQRSSPISYTCRKHVLYRISIANLTSLCYAVS